MRWYIQLLNSAYKRLLNEPYENEVTLTRKNLPIKCSQPLKILTHFMTGLDISMPEIRGL